MAGLSSPRFIYIAAILAGAVVTAAVSMVVNSGGSKRVPEWAKLVIPGDLSQAHAFLEQSCENCHQPYSGVRAGACIECHAGARSILEFPKTAFHATVGECSGCHVEHRGRDRRPITMDHLLLARLGLAQAGPPDASSRTAVSPGLRMFPSGNPTGTASGVPELAPLACAACHANQDRHRGLFGTGCATCHGVTSWQIPDARHPSPKSTECAQCHLAPPSHYMGHFEMVSRTIARQHHARVDQCQLCHQVDAWNNIKGVGWYKHH